ncbi:hypothetical protein [Formosa sediminum]|uniref:hypothetical protein n=1 Tax=Formosa sediminum TaxID=2594004 RepID=UPI00163DDE92|nr:hypothetical protein [Formosa sediminum]
MKNLENFGVKELSAKEMKKTNGGFAWYVWISLSLVAESAVRGMVDGIRDGAAQG